MSLGWNSSPRFLVSFFPIAFMTDGPCLSKFWHRIFSSFSTFPLESGSVADTHMHRINSDFTRILTGWNHTILYLYNRNKLWVKAWSATDPCHHQAWSAATLRSMKQSSRTAKKLVEGLEGRCCEERWAERDNPESWVILSEGGREVLTALQILEGKQRDMLGSTPWWGRTWRNGTRLYLGRMRPGTGKHFFTMRAVKHWNRLPRGVWSPTALSGQVESGQCSQWHALTVD